MPQVENEAEKASRLERTMSTAFIRRSHASSPTESTGNKLMVSKWGREGRGTNEEYGINGHKLLYVK